MTSTFHGLQTAVRGMTTHQSALNTTGHNISNANTEGYTRQRVNFNQTEAYPAAGRNAPSKPGQIGTGVEAGSVQRVREHYLDDQFRGENAKFGYWDGKHQALERMEDVMNEPSEEGISQSMDEFWNSLQDLSTNPEDSGNRSVVRQQGHALAEAFNTTSDSLKSNQRDLGNQIGQAEKDINNMLREIDELNQQIASVEPNGFLPNDLYDKRDQVVDELSEMVDVEVEPEESKGLADELAEGAYNIYLLDQDGNRMGPGDPDPIVNGANLSFEEMNIEFQDEEDNRSPVTDVQIGGSSVGDQILDVNGKLTGMIEAYGYTDDGGEAGLYPDMLSDLNEMVSTFVDEFNEQHREGSGLDGETGRNFFTYESTEDAASSLRVAAEIEDSLDNIAAAGPDGSSGDGSNALELANVKDEELEFGDSTDDVQSFYEGLIGQMAVNTSEAEQMRGNAENLRDNVDHRRQSTSSVSLDEEMTNLIQFQHAYNAAARNITAIDEMLERVINNMGIVGR
ncbi:flagellar hook-associated protein FlgK [Salsuginibacillus kocurii]|uniref:flagellar hook-associated protein FlgK n=1 Tax=Salsuginibacillus kocurii TaxID=427078 RepID=UPI00037E7AB4|nr:flagellar hook-associated protein FlgK [Salsuginibacillus kocurii]